MNSKFSFKRHFSHNIIPYLLAFIIAYATLSYGIDLKLRPKDYEKFSVFVSATVNKKAFVEKLEDILDDSIIEHNVYSCNPTSSTYSEQYFTQGFSSDVMILSKSSIIDKDMKCYLEVPSSYIDVSNYLIEEVPYGIQTFNGEDGVLTDCVNYLEEEYYLFISKESVHLGGLIDEGSKTDAVKTLLEGLFNV